MKIENLFVKRMKELPSDAVTSGHKLALKGGYIHQTGAGLYTYSHLGFKLLQNINNIIRQELNKIGCQEINMPVISPLSLWSKTGRDNIDILLKFKTRAGSDCVINPTHEEIICDFVKDNLQSYKQLPISPNSLCLYQIQTKYRDELRARAGLIRCREFMMKDAYSFHKDEKDLNDFYKIVLNTYSKIYKELGLDNVIVVKAPGGDMGDIFSHEFQMIDETGEDSIYVCNNCKNNFNKEIFTDENSLVCPNCKAELILKRGIEVGNIFKLFTKYSKPMDIKINDNTGHEIIPVMGCYGIGISRVLGCILQQSQNDAQAVFNIKTAPYKVHIINIGDVDTNNIIKLYDALLENNIDTIIDTTDDRAGSKFANADLIGAPIRIINSKKNLENNKYEMKYSGINSSDYPETIDINTVLSFIKSIVK